MKTMGRYIGGTEAFAIASCQYHQIQSEIIMKRYMKVQRKD